MSKTRCLVAAFLVIFGFCLLTPRSSSAQERLCDPSFEDCYTPLLNLINAETVGIDMSFYMIELPDLANAVIARYRAGVPVRLVVEPRGNIKFPMNQQILDQFKAAGIPMRYKLGDGIIHVKLLLLAGQNKVVFTGSNFGDADVRPYDPYNNYVDGAWYFTDDSSVVNSFKTRYDDVWTDTATYGNYANISTALTRKYPTFPIDPAVNFVPNSNLAEDYGARTIALLDRETQKIDLTMYRVTDNTICDALLRAVARGVPVRLLAEPAEYRFDASRLGAEFTGPYNIDRLYAAGVQIRMRKHLGLNHQKSVSLYGQGLTIFGSSNWSWESFNYQEEHNYFTNKTWFFQWFVNQFNRKFTSATEYEDFVPQPPSVPTYLSPANPSTVGTSVMLNWEGGGWAHKYDVYLGTNENSLNLLAADVITGTLGSAGSESYLISGLQSGVTYYWRIVSKTMANQTATGPVWRFTTSGTVPTPTPTPTPTATPTPTPTPTPTATPTPTPTPTPTATPTPTPTPTPGSATDVVLYASEAPVKVGSWSAVSDISAAAGMRIFQPDAGVPKITTPFVNPPHYFEMTFTAQAGQPYRLWIRAKAQDDFWGNDSVWVQFSDSVNSSGAAVFRIGTTTGTEINLEDCSGCGLSGWGWQDNGWGVGVLGPQIFFQSTGTHTIRTQAREDGISIDQIVISPSTYLFTSPGALKNDSTVLPASGGGTPQPQAPTLTSVSPNSGPTAGGTSVNITGTNFSSGATVKFDTNAATSVTVISSTSITATVPAHAAGAVNVVVTNSNGQSATLTSGFTYVAPQGETTLLEDDFNDNSLNLSKWSSNNLFSGFTDSTLQTIETNQRLQIGALFSGQDGSHYNGLRSAAAYNFSGAYSYVELVQAPAATTKADAMFTVGLDPGNYYRVYLEQGVFICQSRIGGTKRNLFTAAYDSSAHRWWRIRHDPSTGRVVFETATDNVSWVVRYSEPWDVGAVPLSSVIFELKGGTWQPESVAPGTVVFDNFRAAHP
jgi:phosphatidylserine/phosphatidylglycerophosphate/cardiolipin synthase-like enzyme